MSFFVLVMAGNKIEEIRAFDTRAEATDYLGNRTGTVYASVGEVEE